MRKSALIAGAVALACAGGVYAAAQNVHVLTVDLPDGSIAQIHYVGDVAPKVTVAPVARDVAMVEPEFDAPFAMLAHVAAELDRQQAAMFARVAAMQEQAPLVQKTDSAPARSGVYHYSYVSTTNGPGGCTQSYALTSYGGAQAPKAVSQETGDCRGVEPLLKTAAPAKPPVLAKPIPAVAKPADPVRISRDSI